MDNPTPDRLTLSPTDFEAEQFVLFILSGMPPLDALSRLVVDLAGWAANAQLDLLKRWQASRAVQAALKKHAGMPWHQLSLEERMKAAIDKQYNEMAYFLHSTNYATLEGQSKLKADTSRLAIESRLAGNSGKLSPMEEFMKEVGKMRAQSGTPATPGPRGTLPAAPPLPEKLGQS